MHWWQGAFASTSKSQSSDDSVISSRPGFFSSRRNRLLRKLRQADADTWRSPSSSHSSFVRSAVAPSSVPPQPLPLPELSVLLHNDPKLASSSSVPLPSPDAIQIPRGIIDDRDREGTIAEAIDGQKSRIVGQDSRTYSERYDTRSSTRSTENQHNKKKSLDCYSINTPISAPTSPYSSTVLSQPMADLWASHYVTPPGIFQVWSAPEMPHSDGNLGLGFSFERRASNVDSSPLQSPRVTLHLPVTSPPRSSSPLTSRDTRWESNAQATVHPLPLPPTYSMPTLSTPRSPVASKSDFSGASISSQPSPVSPVESKPELKPIKSKWQKGKLIGRGTFGSVYVASNRETGALCAMKEVEILPDDSKSAECMRQLEQEIKVLSHLKHPNIVQYYGSQIVGDKFYIYLEYVHPGSINKFINDHCGAITESVVRNFTRHILCGLAYLHSKKTIHRDIKGANLLVDAYGVVKLADFGMAKHLNGQTANLSLKGSPYWMAPELLQSAMQTDASSDIALAVDIWSLGCTIIEMMNGKPPWSEYEGAAALFKVLKETPLIPTTMSAEGKDFLQCCFRRNPADRPTASKLLDHPFVSYSQQPDAGAQPLNETKHSDNMQFLRERSRHKQDQAPRPFDNQMKKGKSSNNESNQWSRLQTSHLVGPTLPSPRSILDALPTLSLPSSGPFPDRSSNAA